MEKKLWGEAEGKKVYLYTLKNSKGMQADVTNYGAIIVNLFAPDKDGSLEDVVLGYDKLEPYFVNGCFLGAVIGPNANRIAGAQFTLDDVAYNLAANDGPNNLHSDKDAGAHKRVWDVEETENAVTFTLEMKDGELGFPGNKVMKVTYEVTEDNALKITYDGVSDKNTILNLTNHSYFNLEGHGAGKIVDHKMQILAKNYTEILPGAIPTGRIVPVADTSMDFTEPHVIGERIDENWEQLTLVGGYDHNWVLDNYDGSVRKIAAVTSPDGSRTMEVFTDLPGVQFYAGNCIEKEIGKDGAVYDYRSGLCLETQYYPDTANEPDFPSAVFGPDRPYHSVTIYKF